MRDDVSIEHDSLEPVAFGKDAGRETGLEAAVARAYARRGLFGGHADGPVVDRFVLLRQVGRGGMGAVYEALDPRLQRHVALKLLSAPTGATAPARARGRMLAEARAMAKLSHVNVVTVYEAGTYDPGDGEPQVFLVMELIEGRTLRQWVQEEEPNPREILAAYRQAAEGLAAVHRAGLVHRDFKPDNAMIDAEGRVRVMDFGIVQDAASAAPWTVTRPGTVDGIETTAGGEPGPVGTPAYMAPEQLFGDEIDHRSDQYAFCSSLYEALYGERPSRMVPPAELSRPPRDPVPTRWRAAILRGLAEDPDERFPSMQALLDALVDRRSVRNAVLVGTALFVLGGVAMGAFMKADTGACAGGDELYAQVWNDQVGTEVRASYRATGRSYADELADRIVGSIDAHRDRWLIVYRSACTATLVDGTQSDEVLARRRHCLDLRLHELQANLGVWRNADAEVVDRTTDMLERLTPPSACAEPGIWARQRDLPLDPRLREATQRLEQRIAEVEALRTAGRLNEARVLAHEIAVDAERAGLRAVRAEAEVLAGALEAESGDWSHAKELLANGYFMARASQASTTAARAALTLGTFSPGEVDDDHSSHWRNLARAEIEAHDLQTLRFPLLLGELHAARRAGEYDRALELANDLRMRAETLCEGPCSQLAQAHEELSSTHGNLGRTREAVEHAREFVAIERALHPAGHPHVATALARLGDALGSAGDVQGSIEALRHAYEIRRALFDPSHINLVNVQTQLAVALAADDQLDEALELLRASVEHLRPIGGIDLAFTLNQISHVYSEAGKLDDALEAAEEAADLMREAFPDGHPALAIVLSNVGHYHLVRGENEAALALFEEGLAMRRRILEGEDRQQATFLLNVARALANLGRHEAAEERLHEAVLLTEDDVLTETGIAARRRLARLVEAHDPDAAAQLDAEIERRCAELPESHRARLQCDGV